MFNYHTEQQSKLSIWKRFWGKSRLERVLVQFLFFGYIIGMMTWVVLKVFNQ